MDANEARKIATNGAIEAIHKLIEKEAHKGLNYLDLSTYEGLYTSDEVYEVLIKEGYHINGDMIRWGVNSIE